MIVCIQLSVNQSRYSLPHDIEYLEFDFRSLRQSEANIGERVERSGIVGLKLNRGRQSAIGSDSTSNQPRQKLWQDTTTMVLFIYYPCFDLLFKYTQGHCAVTENRIVEVTQRHPAAQFILGIFAKLFHLQFADFVG